MLDIKQALEELKQLTVHNAALGVRNEALAERKAAFAAREAAVAECEADRRPGFDCKCSSTCRPEGDTVPAPETTRSSIVIGSH